MRNEALFRKFTLFASTCALAMLTSAHSAKAQTAKKANEIAVFTCSVCDEDEMFGDGEDYQPTLMVPAEPEEDAQAVDDEPAEEIAPEEADVPRCASGCRMTIIMIASLFDPEISAPMFSVNGNKCDTKEKMHRHSPVVRNRIANHDKAHIYVDFPQYISGNRLAA